MSIQIPNLHTSNNTEVNIMKGALVSIKGRHDSSHAGEFFIEGYLKFDATTDQYPSAHLTMKIDLSDSAKGTVLIDSVEQLDSLGRDTPTAYATGRCVIDTDYKTAGCRYWCLFANNKNSREKETPDTISFLIFDRNGKRVAYGTGPVVKGDIAISPSHE